jgi:hypothetical protein
VLLSLSAVFLRYILPSVPAWSLVFQLCVLALQPILMGLYAGFKWSSPYIQLAEIVFICNAYIVLNNEGLWPSNIIGMHAARIQISTKKIITNTFSLASLPSILQKAAITLPLLMGDIIFKVLTYGAHGTREGMPRTFVEIFMIYGRQFVIDIAKAMMDFAAAMGHGFYGWVEDTGSNEQRDVELGARVNSAH